MVLFTQADADVDPDVDAGKWVSDPFQVATLAAILTLPLLLGVNEL